jgi:hypothetical protein
VNVCETVVAALVAIGQPGVIDAEPVQDGGIEVVDVDAIFDNIVASSLVVKRVGSYRQAAFSDCSSGIAYFFIR